MCVHASTQCQRFLLSKVLPLSEFSRVNHQPRPVQYREIEGLIEAITSRCSELHLPSAAHRRGCVSSFYFMFHPQIWNKDLRCTIQDLVVRRPVCAVCLRCSLVVILQSVFCELSGQHWHTLLLMLSCNTTPTSYVIDMFYEGLIRFVSVVFVTTVPQCCLLFQTGILIPVWKLERCSSNRDSDLTVSRIWLVCMCYNECISL